MPELPEVETIRHGLNKLIIGKTVQAVDFNWPKSFPNASSDVQEFLIGATITDVRRRAKVLLIDLDTEYSLVIHLKMTGQLVFVAKNQVDGSLQIVDREDKRPTTNYKLPTNADEVRFGAGHPNDSLIGKLPDKSTRVTITLENVRGQSSHKDSGEISRLYFNDQRKFGWMRLMMSCKESISLF